MTLVNTLNATSLSALENVRTELFSHYKSLTPKERGEGFLRYLRANNVESKVKQTLRRYKETTDRQFSFEIATTFAMQNSYKLVATHSVGMKDAVAQGIVLSLAHYDLKVSAYRLLEKITADLGRAGLV